MAIYGINGEQLSSAYSVSGTALTAAYSMTGTQVFPDEPIPPAEANFVVMTHNVQKFWNGLEQSQALQEYFVETYNPDFIGMQEIGGSSLPALAANALVDYPYVEIGPDAVVNKPGFVSKAAVRNANSVAFQAQQGTENRGYNIGRITANGKDILIINTHLHPSQQATKIAQAQEIQALVQNEEYFIITGDFNTVCMSTSHAEYIGIYKPFVDMGCHLANCSDEAGWHYTYFSATTPEESAKGPNDSIIISPSIELVDVVFDTYKFQLAAEQAKKIDHIPIIAYLAIP